MKLDLVQQTLIASLLLAGLSAFAGTAAAGGYANAHLLMETQELAPLSEAGKVSIVDVRPREAYEAGHIPGAVHLGADDIIDQHSSVDGNLLPVDVLARMFGERGIGKATPVVFYDDQGGFHASRLFWLLEYLGHRQVSVLNGGFPKWQNEGRAVTADVPEVQPQVFSAAPTPRRLATADWLLDRQDDAAVVVIDVRPEKLYRAGHIPWAKSIPWKQNLASDGTLKSAEELQQHFASLGVTPEKNIAVHCQNGKAAAHSYFTLRLLG